MAIRLFLAVWLSPELRENVTGLVGRLRSNSNGIKWATPEQMHFTLKFLGEHPSSLLEKLIPIMTETAAKMDPFPLSLGAGGVFPPKGDPRVLWVGLTEGAEEIKHLAGKMEEACVRVGLDREEKPFHPHLTIGRVKMAPGAFDRELLGSGATGRMRVESFMLVESSLKPSGPIYQTLHEFKLV